MATVSSVSRRVEPSPSKWYQRVWFPRVMLIRSSAYVYEASTCGSARFVSTR
jgi:hypothetical protein